MTKSNSFHSRFSLLRTFLSSASLLALPAAAADSAKDAIPPPPKKVDGVEGATMIKANGGWCWYQGPRAIVSRDGRVMLTTISGVGKAGLDAGDLWLTAWDPAKKAAEHFELHDRFHRDDHDLAALLEREDGSVLAVYGKHNNDKLQRWRISGSDGDVSKWSAEKTFDVGARYTYSNVFRLSEEDGKIYNFHRGHGWNPNCTVSTDDGETWSYGWRLFDWSRGSVKGDPKYTGTDGGRPYPRYASNDRDAIHFVTSEDHPRAYDNSIYHGFYRAGKLHASDGTVVGEPGAKGKSKLKPTEFTQVFEGDRDHVAWTVDLELDDQERPYTVFSVQVDGAKYRGKRSQKAGLDHRYYYARYDGKNWHVNEAAYAGTKLYAKENDYTGLAALDPDDPNTMVISTNTHPVNGEPLISESDGKRHWELFKGTTADGGKTWNWVALTQNSDTDNLRPLIPENPDGERHILWCRGKFHSYKNYDLDICIISEKRK